MIFTSSFLTTAGIQLLTQAASGSRIVWTDCGCSHVVDQATITAATTTFDNFVCKGTAVATFNETGNVAAISCSMTNNDQYCTEGDADIFGLWAHVVDPLGNIGNDVLVLIAKRGSAPATHFPEYVDETTELTAIVDLSVEMNDGVVASINLIQSAFALARDLQTEISAREALSARVASNEDVCSRAVTTHASGTPTAGEAQTIYGNKTFADNLTANYAITAPGITKDQYIYLRASNGGYNSQIELAVGVAPGYDREITLNTETVRTMGSIVPYSGCTLGDSDGVWDNTYTSAINLPITEEYSSSVSGREVLVAGNTIFNGSGNLKLLFGYSYTGHNYDGTGKYQRPESSSIRLDNTLLDAQGSPASDLQILIKNQAYDSSSSLTIYSLYSSSTRINIGQYNDNVDLRVYGTISTLAPTDGSQNSELPIGALALVLVYSPGNNVPYTSSQAKTGAVIRKSALSISDLEMYYADFDNTGAFLQGNRISITPSMGFRLLSGLAGTGGGVALVMRIA